MVSEVEPELFEEMASSGVVKFYRACYGYSRCTFFLGGFAMGMRVFDLCSSCMHLLEIKKMDPPVEIPVTKCCRVIKVQSCVHLGRLWPVCRNGEDVFTQSATCQGFCSGIPKQLSFLIVAPVVGVNLNENISCDYGDDD